jgi:hypothetical protein
MASLGGKRPRSGRHPRATVRVECSVPRQIYDELVRLEGESGVYRTRIAASLLTEAVVNQMVDRDLSKKT